MYPTQAELEWATSQYIENSAGSRIQIVLAEIILVHVGAELRRNFAQLRAGRRGLRVPFLGYFLYSSHGIGLRSFLSLNDVELDLVPFL
jgi:hypothetical protein